jgi:hypothetical protein
MSTPEEVRKIVNDEIRKINGLLTSLPWSDEFKKERNIYRSSLDSLHITQECLSDLPSEECNFIGDFYFLTVKYKGKIVMSMCCFPNNEYKYQFNMLITKFYNVEYPGNISILMHSYACSLFNNDYILVRPLREMGKILMAYFPSLWIIRRFGNLINCSDEIIQNHVRIENDTPTWCIRITEEFKSEYLNRSDLEFNCVKLK